VKYPAFRKRGEEAQVGDLVKHKAGAQLGVGLVARINPESDLVTVFWSRKNNLRYCSRPYLEVLSESR